MASTLTIKDRTEFPWNESDFAGKIGIAVKAYWNARRKQAKKQNNQGKKDAGTRGEVTGARHLNAFAHLFLEVIKASGYKDSDVFFAKPLALPGYYRAQKKWDIVVTKDDSLVTAIELKSQSGSFGNNLNNRSEEVLGLSRDFWIAYRERAFGLTRQPWLGYFFLLEESSRSTTSVKLDQSKFPAFPIFKGASYMDRYRILCERLVLERDYSATALLASPKDSRDGKFIEPSDELKLYKFSKSLFAHLMAYN